MPIKLKRAYDPPADDDGVRILVERLWPRGISKERASLDDWLKDIAPSPELRKWYGHDPDKWPEFQERYVHELTRNTELVTALRDRCAGQTVTFVFAARDEVRNSAAVLKAFLEGH